MIFYGVGYKYSNNEQWRCSPIHVYIDETHFKTLSGTLYILHVCLLLHSSFFYREKKIWKLLEPMGSRMLLFENLKKEFLLIGNNCFWMKSNEYGEWFFLDLSRETSQKVLNIRVWKWSNLLFLEKTTTSKRSLPLPSPSSADEFEENSSSEDLQPEQQDVEDPQPMEMNRKRKHIPEPLPSSRISYFNNHDW